MTEKPGRALRRRGKDLPGDPGLRGIAAWPLPVTLLLVLVLGSAVVAGAYWLLALLAPIDESSGLTAAQRLTAAFATATALGAMAALVINIRKQDLAEQAARREIASAFTERFRAAASQLGGVSPAERLAGVYAMAALADEYPRRSQQCVDVLCEYLRLPFNPDTDNLASQTSTTATASESGAAGSIASTTATRPFDSQVRQTIVTVIRAHTQPDAAPSWSHLNYDFTGAHLENANFRKAQFTGTAIFDGAQFTSRANFRKAKFTGTAIFGGAQFTGTADFDGAKFTGTAIFDGAQFTGTAQFIGAKFTGTADFDGAQFTDLAIFAWAQFTSRAIFDGAKFTSRAIFDGAQFTGPAQFGEAQFSGSVRFRGAQFGGTATFGSGGVQQADLIRWGATFENAPPPASTEA